ncbi:DoxX family protein [Tsukamurella sp. 8F]|uniref:DoxX family protein n=1 Tax=unclassified Tsukamurella TaxID=2633480 RepID=UPI0023B8AA54|nr:MULTISPECIES: DoxX family protein [unclassified Tsukamurella]MDF0532404.1 DoxX family protein [Tsukamurella sp. 8J]MDF0588610.1 DoxX family protein [Tsukamurella sp. 8F]
MTRLLTHGQNTATTVARVIIGIVFVAHGWQKFSDYGIAAVGASFEKMGVPAPHAAAWFSGIAELAGGVLLIVGVAIPVVAVVLIVDMLGAIFTAHSEQGLIGGYELPLALIAGLVAVGLANQGPLAADTHVLKRFAKGDAR